MFSRYVVLTQTTDIDEGARIRDILNKNNISFKTKAENARINPAPNFGTSVGGVGNGAMKFTTIFLVQKEDLDYARALIRS